MVESIISMKIANFMSGGSTLASAAIALFFLKFWRKTGDRFFAYFAAAFAMFSLERLLFLSIDAANDIYNETYTSVFVIRLLAFLLIIAAILEKNRKAR